MTSYMQEELASRGRFAELISPCLLITEVGPSTITVHPFGDYVLPAVLVLTVSTDQLSALHSGALLEQAGVPVINPPSAILTAADKFQSAVILRSRGLPVPRAVSVSTVAAAVTSATSIGYLLGTQGPIGSEGRQVHLIATAAELEGAIKAVRLSLGHEVSNHTPIVLQELIHHTLGRDRRLFVVGGKVLAAMDRLARPGDWKSQPQSRSHSCGGVRYKA